MPKKLTPWFHSDDANPSRPGVYIATVSRNRNFYRRWDGERWHFGSYDGPQQAASIDQHWDHRCASLWWRGLAQDPSAKQKKGKK